MTLNSISTRALVRICFVLGFTLLAIQLFAQSPLDRWYEEESIMNRDNPNNAWYNGPATTSEYDFADFALESDNGECAACFTPNPPPFCFEPGHHCHQASMPIDSGIVILILGGALFGAYTIRKSQLNAQQVSH